MISEETRKNIEEILNVLSNAGLLAQPYKREVYTSRLEQYAQKFEEEQGLQAMLDFISWAKIEDFSENEMLATVLHDLSHMNDSFMCPRTLGYLGKG